MAAAFTVKISDFSRRFLWSLRTFCTTTLVQNPENPSEKAAIVMVRNSQVRTNQHFWLLMSRVDAVIPQGDYRILLSVGAGCNTPQAIKISGTDKLIAPLATYQDEKHLQTRSLPAFYHSTRSLVVLPPQSQHSKH